MSKTEKQNRNKRNHLKENISQDFILDKKYESQKHQSIGSFEEDKIDKNELKGLLNSLQDKNNSFNQSIQTQYLSFVDNKRKRFISISSDQYYFLSNNVSIKELQITHFNYLNFIQTNYQLHKSHFHVLFSYIFQEDKLRNYTRMSSLKDKNNKISSHKGIFPTFLTMQPLPSQTLWRVVKSSQYQSFYTCIVFALLEKWIENKRIDDLFAFCLDSFRIRKIYSVVFSSVTFYEYSVMLNLIYDAVSLGHYNEIMDIFVNYFNAFNDIEIILITYVKYCIYLYLQSIYLNSADSDSKIELNYFDFEEIISPYHETSRLIVELVSIIYNVNIDIYYPNKKAKKFDCVSFTPERMFNNNNIKIELIYLYSSFHLFYSKGNYNSNVKSENTYIMYQPSEDNCLLICKNCKKQTRYITYTHDKKEYYFCYNCLNDYIVRIMNERTVIFSDNSFLYKELFSRPIPLSKRVHMCDAEIFYCFNESLHNLLLKNLLLNCNICKQKFQKEEIVPLECTCLYCSSCLNNFMMEQFEKTLEKKLSIDMENKFMLQCKICDKQINLKEILKFFSSTYDIYTKIRNDFFSTHCSICGKLTKNSNSDFSGIIFEPLSIKEEVITSLTPEQGSINHNLCWKCYKNISKKGSNKDGTDANICLICRKTHKIITSQFSEKKNKKEKNDHQEETNENLSTSNINVSRATYRSNKSNCNCLIM